MTHELKFFDAANLGELDSFTLDAITHERWETSDDLSKSETDALVTAIAPSVSPAQVSTAWISGARSISRTHPRATPTLNRDRPFSLVIDGLTAQENAPHGPNVQEVILAALNAFIVKTFADCCEQQQLELEAAEVTSTGSPDFWALLGQRPTFLRDDPLCWTLTVKGNASLEDFQRVFKQAFGTSPNDWNLVVLF